MIFIISQYYNHSNSKIPSPSCNLYSSNINTRIRLLNIKLNYRNNIIRNALTVSAVGESCVRST